MMRKKWNSDKLLARFTADDTVDEIKSGLLSEGAADKP